MKRNKKHFDLQGQELGIWIPQNKKSSACLNQSSIHELDCWKNIQKQTLRCHIVFSRENTVEEKWRLANLFAVHAHGLKLKTMNWYQLLQFQYQQGSNPIPLSASEPQWTPKVYPKGSDSQDWKKWTLRRLRIQAAEEEYLKADIQMVQPRWPMATHR